MIRVELVKLVRNRRTWVTIALIDALPTLVAVLLAVTDLGPRPGTGPAFLSAVLTDGTLFPLAALGIVLPLFLPIAVAITAGEAIAGEAQQGTLRYMLVRPVGRTRLLVAKLVAVMAFVVLTVLVVAATAYVLGVLLLGNETVTATGPAERLGQLDVDAGAGRADLAGAGVRDALHARRGRGRAVPVHRRPSRRSAPRSGTMALLVASTLLLTLDAADALRPYLPTRYWLAFVDLFRDPILWRDVLRGVLLQVVYVVVFLGAGWANFMTKDITD